MIWPGNDVYCLNFPIKVHICSAYLFWDCSARDCNGLVSEYRTSRQLNMLLICLTHHIHILSSCSTSSHNYLAIICRTTSGPLQGLIADQCLPSNGSRNKTVLDKLLATVLFLFLKWQIGWYYETSLQCIGNVTVYKHCFGYSNSSWVKRKNLLFQELMPF